MLLARKIQLTVATLAVCAAAITGSAQAAPSHAEPSPGPLSVSVEFGSAKAGSSYSRTSGRTQEPFTLTIKDNKGKTRGRMLGVAKQREWLNARSRKWFRDYSITITSASGLAAKGASITTRLSCGGCSATGAKSGTLRKGKTYLAWWDVTSKGSKTLSHRPMPVQNISFPGGITMKNGHPMAMRAVRCDSQKYLGKPGCVYSSWVPNFFLSRSDKAVNEAASHYYSAERSLTGKPGLAKPLHRASEDVHKKNRNKTKYACTKKRQAEKPKGKKDCDEYPFASVSEGGQTSGGKPVNGKLSLKFIASDDNQEAGRRLASFFKSARVLRGDGFYVRVG